jgi:hypothetical protein
MFKFTIDRTQYNNTSKIILKLRRIKDVILKSKNIKSQVGFVFGKKRKNKKNKEEEIKRERTQLICKLFIE